MNSLAKFFGTPLPAAGFHRSAAGGTAICPGGGKHLVICDEYRSCPAKTGQNLRRRGFSWAGSLSERLFNFARGTRPDCLELRAGYEWAQGDAE